MLDKRLLPALLLLALPAAGQESAPPRSLYWDEIAVNAHLDARGTLHVRERQSYVFTGDWNGGERSFRVGFNQHLELEGLYGVTEDGREIPLVEGDIDQVDHYEWADGDTLRWRSRLPSDPPFDGTARTYVIAYSLSGILNRDGDDWLLNHDFSLPEAQWLIESLVVDLDLDPAWQQLDRVPTRFTRRHLPAGDSVIVRTRLRHSGAVPVEGSGAAALAPAWLRRGLFAGALLVMIALYLRFRKHEAGRGRFEPLPEIPWDEAWLRQNVFDLKAEEVGALWDQKIGPPEVAAVLARLVSEGKMTSEVRPGFKIFGKSLTPGVLHLRLTMPRNGLPDYERALVDKLFFEGDETDTDRVKRRYKSTGFNPASVIEKPLRELLASHDKDGPVPAPGRRRTFLLFLAFVVLFGVEIGRSPSPTAALTAMTLFLLLWPTGIGLIFAFAWRRRTEHLDAASLTFLIPGLIAWGICLALAFLPLGALAPGLFAAIGLAVAPLAVWSSLLNNARSRESDETIRKRRTLAAARHLFQEELESEHPRLKDEWLPYLLAFGLGTNVDRWFRSFGTGSGRGISTMSTGGSGGSGGGSWSGGGGSFGGGGATGAWAVAATGLASGVSAPSSSGSSGGGGGSSSGGGGGGGW
ncbi:MAG: hypothetical protein ABUT39_23635 [Acidobacteriota bacterium]